MMKIDRSCIEIDENKVKTEERFDGKWVLTTNTTLPANEMALKYKEIRQVEQVVPGCQVGS